MDKPTLSTLHELTGDGTQTILGAAGTSGTVDFYRLDIITPCVFDDLLINGVAQTALVGVTVSNSASFHNVTEVNVTSGVCIGYTAPALTGNIE
jgi:hypothetical protein|tara:strand:- start:357 stop:638 length:282 start_codon:yes stop_codon:yes gene_type:complete